MNLQQKQTEWTQLSIFSAASRSTREAITAMLLVPAALLSLTSCSSTHKVEKETTVAYHEGVPGGTLVETYKIGVTVVGIDAAARKVTLVAPDGSRNTFAAGSGFSQLDQLHVGDQAQATVTRQLVVFLRKSGEPPKDDQVTATVLTGKAAESGMLKSDTVQRIARVGAINSDRREATLDFADGTSRTFAVRDDVNLHQIKAGEEVVIRTTSAAVLTLEKQ